jgi:hypothetical protein
MELLEKRSVLDPTADFLIQRRTTIRQSAAKFYHKAKKLPYPGYDSRENAAGLCRVEAPSPIVINPNLSADTPFLLTDVINLAIRHRGIEVGDEIRLAVFNSDKADLSRRSFLLRRIYRQPTSEWHKGHGNLSLSVFKTLTNFLSI